MHNMKRLSTTNLPTLQANSKHSKSKESVRLIENKITQHENEITRNQKVIISLTNDFRLLKDQLQTKLKELDEITDMHAKAVQENQRLTKSNKQMRQSLMKLQKALEEKDKKSITARPEDTQKLKQLNQQLSHLQQEAAETKKAIRILETGNSQLTKQNDKLRDEMNQAKKLADDKFHNNLAEHEKEVKQLQLKIDELKTELSSKTKQLNEQDSEIVKWRHHAKDKQSKLKQINKLEKSYNELKDSLDRNMQQLKSKNMKIEQLEKQLIKNQDADKMKAEFASKIEKLQTSEQALAHKCGMLQKQLDEVKKQNHALAEQDKKNKKKQDKIKKIAKARPQLLQAIKSIEGSIKCELCCKVLDKPVTSIPCGHSYCFECKKGYERQCKKCVGVKREAVYRNQLLDQVIEGYKAMTSLSQSLVNIE